MDPVYMLYGFLTGMIVASIFMPIATEKRLIPEMGNEHMTFRNPNNANGCFRVKSYRVSCTDEIDLLNK